MAPLANDDEWINAGGRSIEHRNQYRRIKGEDVKSASGLEVLAVPLVLNDAATQPNLDPVHTANGMPPSGENPGRRAVDL